MESVTSAQRKLQRVYEQAKEAERRHLMSESVDKTAVIEKLQSRMEEFAENQKKFLSTMRNDFRDVIKEQQTFAKSLPKCKSYKNRTSH